MTRRLLVPPYTHHAEHLLLWQILKKVSRSFYLSLRILPRAVRPQVGLAYLFCRIADTIADTRILPHAQRLQALETFREQFRLSVPAFPCLAELQGALLPHHAAAGEQQLMQHLSDCFRLFRQFSAADQCLIRDLVCTLTLGMRMDLRCFPGETAATAQALPDLAALDQYTYYVAGVVGEFWTKIHAAHLGALQHCDLAALKQLGVSFGKGLQLTNILRDIAKDLQHGRCYLPEEQLVRLGIDLAALGQPETLVRLRPLLMHLVRQTLIYLDQAHAYVVRLPWRAFRMRLGCMWPLLFAVQTVEAICRSDDLLRPEARVRIPRAAIYRTMLWSCGCLVSRRFFSSYYQSLRRRLVALLPAEFNV